MVKIWGVDGTPVWQSTCQNVALSRQFPRQVAENKRELFHVERGNGIRKGTINDHTLLLSHYPLATMPHYNRTLVSHTKPIINAYLKYQSLFSKTHYI